MRTLTLGVLIVSGGTLAALPFRRHPSIPDASAAPAQVTGPTQSVLDRSTTQPAHPNVLAADEAPVESTVDTSPPPAPRSDAPLTYEDLVQPIEPPPVIEKRFNAIVRVRDQTLQRERVAGLLMPDVESLAVSQQEELRRVAESAATTLASTTKRESKTERLPQPTKRQRHWIHQP